MEKVKKKKDIWTIFVYLILYSIAGFFIETTFGIFSKGVIESRKSFLYGPFCAIYGIGAIAIIMGLKNEKNIFKLFIGGAIIGAVVEYLMSFICEKFFGVKWWDYSEYFLNVQGRTCLFFAVSWGLLGIVLLKVVNPYVDRLIEVLRNNNRIFKTTTTAIILFFCMDAIITSLALKTFYCRVATEKDLNIENKLAAQQNYLDIQASKGIAGFINTHYNDKVMLKNYPNMIIEEKDSNLVYIDSLLKEFDSYYYRLGDAF